MATLYVASSKCLQEWGADVGLGKHLYKVGVAETIAPQDSVNGQAGQADWKILLTADCDSTEAAMLERLATKEKLVDPNYYPRLKGTVGIVKINTGAVENAMMIAIALENREPPKALKAKPADIAKYLVRNLLK